MATPSPPDLIGQSATWLESLERVSLAALVERPILVIGERGTGKELIAERLHYLSPRWDKPFVKAELRRAVGRPAGFRAIRPRGRCASRASQAAARPLRAGRWRRLFLDEIATASDAGAGKASARGRVRAVPAARRRGHDNHGCAVWRRRTSTCRGAPPRADWPTRIACAFDVITLAPLRARPEDIILLAEHFGQRIARELEGDFPGWSRSALEAMCDYSWPGNVRDARTPAERATFRIMAAQANGAPLGPADLSPDMLDPFNWPWRPSKELFTPVETPRAGHAPAPPDECQ